jgi:hypothetical protein
VGEREYESGRLEVSPAGAGEMNPFTNKVFIYSPRRYKDLIDWILTQGYPSSPHGTATREIIDAHLLVKDPRDRLIYDEGRRMNIAFAAAEFFHMMAGADEARFLVSIVPKMENFSDMDTNTIIGAYGPRVDGVLSKVIELLERDKDSRQAVVPIFRSNDISRIDGIMPCTLSIQFLNRENRLHAIANMRSNDAVWGLTYDVFSFTMLQEVVAVSLGLELGEYRHNDGSLHLYLDRDRELVNKLSAKRYTLKMGKIAVFPHWERAYMIAKSAVDLTSRDFWASIDLELDPIIRDLLLCIRHWFARKAKDLPEERVSYDEVRDPAIKKVLSLWRL